MIDNNSFFHFANFDRNHSQRQFGITGLVCAHFVICGRPAQSAEMDRTECSSGRHIKLPFGLPLFHLWRQRGNIATYEGVLDRSFGRELIHFYLFEMDSSQIIHSSFQNATTVSVNSTAGNPNKNLCLSDIASDLDSCQITEIFSYFPLVLIFFAQFALGIGTALHFSLGQSYLDDNVKMKDSPLLQSYALSMRMFGPVLGYYLGFFTLNIYVDPSKTPIIMSKDPRWVGAWWLGWIFLSILLLIFSVLIALFPRKLPTRKKSLQGVAGEGEQKEFIELEKNPKSEKTEKSQLKGLFLALIRIPFPRFHLCFYSILIRFSMCIETFVNE